MINKSKGFTLIEVMVVVVILVILSALAVRGYAVYVRLAQTSLVEKEITQLMYELESHRLKNLSYAGFPTSSLTVPKGKPYVYYSVAIYDLEASGNPSLNHSSAEGRSWVIKATPRKTGYPIYLANSYGTKCSNESATAVDNLGCSLIGSSGHDW